ncbi:hypothetical protein [uncultured Cohaesibacter sp.]|uniref:hypothetical protein n=1 Tax=uncultured Cohaesibacter sp. TaxID=1002546 RepID=UPI00292E965E|nr:hypothetical protein [uncultured Cohaesibacter sp.]
MREDKLIVGDPTWSPDQYGHLPTGRISTVYTIARPEATARAPDQSRYAHMDGNA